jgi:nitrite reductase/ring-hydroxylating ferredoxin subunit
VLTGQWRAPRRGPVSSSAARGEPFAVGRRCRHQLRDLSDGRVDDDGCLVCPWHGARYDVRNGEMVGGPRGLAFYVGPTPGYTQLVRALARWVPLEVGGVVRLGRRLRVR